MLHDSQTDMVFIYRALKIHFHNCNRFDYSQEYINSLANGRDIRIFSVLHDEEEAIGKQIRDITKAMTAEQKRCKSIETNSIFVDVIAAFYNNERDELTLKMLNTEQL